MIEWLKNLFKSSTYGAIYGDIAEIAEKEEEKFVPAPIVFEYKVYLRDAGKTVTITATGCSTYDTIYAFYYGGRIVGLFEKDVVRYIKADIPEELLNEV